MQVVEGHTLRTAGDLLRLVDVRLPDRFHTGNLAEKLDISRSDAQRIVYCLRNTGAILQVGKQGNAWVYECAKAA